MDEVISMNQILQNLVKETRKKYPQFDIAYGSSIEDFKLELSFLAEDCFHPNFTGQQRISDLLWIDQPWFK